MVSYRDAPRIMLVGAGFMGLLALRYLTALGHRVHVIEPRESARQMATQWGAEAVFSVEESKGLERASESVVLEATGGAAGLELAGDLVAIDGALGVLGYHQAGGGRRNIDMQGWNFKAIGVFNMHNRSIASILRCMDRSQRSSALGFIKPSDLVTSYLSLDELPEVFSGRASHDAIKTVFAGPAADHAN
jgi:threonine dehydrogenase-like Zn-dependent dehydrogenase